MLNKKKSEETIENSITGTEVGPAYLCLHGHFYQPPREDPFTGQIPIEPMATPYDNFNEKITSECYRPNVEAGNFAAISYDLGPTLAGWLEEAHPDVYQRIIDADQKHIARYGVGNAIAQSYNHTILPLAKTRDKRAQILWGLSDFRHRYGRNATGLWLPETAVDIESLDLMAQNGITYTVLATWQSATPVDPTEPYQVSLPGGRSITVFFFNAPLSGGVSFDWDMTNNADLFAASFLPEHLVQSKRDAGEAQLILIATDGELYGHHRPWRDKFLMHLIQTGAPSYGFEICTLEHYMRMYPPAKEAHLRLPSAWSCGLFLEALDRIEPRNNIAFASSTISLTWQALGIDLQSDFVNDLRAVKSWRVPLTGADVYRQLPIVRPDQLPPLPLSLPKDTDEEENIA